MHFRTQKLETAVLRLIWMFPPPRTSFNGRSRLRANFWKSKATNRSPSYSTYDAHQGPACPWPERYYNRWPELYYNSTQFLRQLKIKLHTPTFVVHATFPKHMLGKKGRPCLSSTKTFFILIQPNLVVVRRLILIRLILIQSQRKVVVWGKWVWPSPWASFCEWAIKSRL